MPSGQGGKGHHFPGRLRLKGTLPKKKKEKGTTATGVLDMVDVTSPNLTP